MPRYRWAIEIRISRIEQIGFDIQSRIHKRVVFHAMERETEDQPLTPDGGGQLAQEIAPGTHSFGVPTSQRAVVHCETIVMLGHRHHVASARLLEEYGPLCGLVPLDLEQRNEILITELIRRAVMFRVPLRDLRIAVHVLGVP